MPCFWVSKKGQKWRPILSKFKVNKNIKESDLDRIEENVKEAKKKWDVKYGRKPKNIPKELALVKRMKELQEGWEMNNLSVLGLPAEILIQIFAYVEGLDVIAKLSLVCMDIYGIVNDDSGTIFLFTTQWDYKIKEAGFGKQTVEIASDAINSKRKKFIYMKIFFNECCGCKQFTVDDEEFDYFPPLGRYICTDCTINRKFPLLNVSNSRSKHGVTKTRLERNLKGVRIPWTGSKLGYVNLYMESQVKELAKAMKDPNFENKYGKKRKRKKKDDGGRKKKRRKKSKKRVFVPLSDDEDELLNKDPFEFPLKKEEEEFIGDESDSDSGIDEEEIKAPPKIARRSSRLRSKTKPKYFEEEEEEVVVIKKKTSGRKRKRKEEEEDYVPRKKGRTE